MSFYDEIGGHETIAGIVHRFYAGVATDDFLRAMYPEEDLGPAEDRFQPLEDLDLRGVIAVGRGLVAVEQIVTHAMAILGRQARWQARFSKRKGRRERPRLVAFRAQAGNLHRPRGLVR